MPKTVLMLACAMATVAPLAHAADVFTWSHLADLPDAHGVAGCFAGVVASQAKSAGDGNLVVAGGANFPDGPPWADGRKVWQADSWSLSAPDAAWQAGPPLPRPLAYGVSASFGGRLWCVGGGDATEHVRSTVAIRRDPRSDTLVVEHDALPPLPRAVAFGAGVLVGSRLFLAGGQEAPSASVALNTLWSIDLAAAVRGDNPDWREHPPWPGPPRILPVLGERDGRVYLVSGAELVPLDPATAADGPPVPAGVTRRFLADAYAFDPAGETWQVLAPPPVPLVAAPSPPISIGSSQLAIVSGDDGSLFERRPELADRHPGFSRTIHLYDTVTNTWRTAGDVPTTVADRVTETQPVVTTPTVAWRGRTVIPSGETRPGVRTPAVLTVVPKPQPAVFGAVEWGVLAAYLAALVGIGVACAGGERTTADFFLGGSRIPWWAAGLSIFGTSLSAITFLSIPARAYATDWSMILLNAGIVLVAPVVVTWYLPAFRSAGITTAYELLERRFSLSLRLFGAASFCLFQVGRMGIVILLPALAISAVTGIPVQQAIVAMGVLATLYTALGGIEAVIWTDVLQVVVLLGGATIALVTALVGIEGGPGRGWDLAVAADKLTVAHWSWQASGDALWVILLGAIFANGLVPYTADQSVIQRYLTTPDERQAARAIWTNALIAIPATLLFFALGTALWCFYATRPADVPVLAAPAELVPWFATTQLPTGLGGLVVAGIFAAAMSSLDSSMHSVSTVITTDVVQRFHPAGSDASRLRIARGLVLLLGVIGTVLALWMATVRVPHLWDLFVTLMGLLGGPLAGVFFLAVFTRHVQSHHAWVGVGAAIAAVAALTFGTTANGLLAGAVGQVTCIATALVARALSRRP